MTSLMLHHKARSEAFLVLLQIFLMCYLSSWPILDFTEFINLHFVIRGKVRFMIFNRYEGLFLRKSFYPIFYT